MSVGSAAEENVVLSMRDLLPFIDSPEPVLSSVNNRLTWLAQQATFTTKKGAFSERASLLTSGRVGPAPRATFVPNGCGS